MKIEFSTGTAKIKTINQKTSEVVDDAIPVKKIQIAMLESLVEVAFQRFAKSASKMSAILKAQDLVESAGDCESIDMPEPAVCLISQALTDCGDKKPAMWLRHCRSLMSDILKSTPSRD